MQDLHRIEVLTNQVMALFAGSALSFNLPNGATFADLADRLDDLSERHDGAPTAVYLKFRANRQQSLIRQPRA
jgi:hypothetical protein